MNTRDKEEAIEALLFNHPYLLDKGFSFENRHRRQLVYPGGRIDIVFMRRGKAVLVEIKRTVLLPADVKQLAAYLEDLKDSMRLSTSHYLVGKFGEKVPARVRTQSGFTIKTRIIGKHIPERLKFNAATRRYVAARDADIQDVLELRI